jgi:hypothetical protein
MNQHHVSINTNDPLTIPPPSTRLNSLDSVRIRGVDSFLILSNVIFECMACGYQSPKWMGKCPNCGAWNQMEEIVEKAANPKHINTNDPLTIPPPSTRLNSLDSVRTRGVDSFLILSNVCTFPAVFISINRRRSRYW